MASIDEFDKMSSGARKSMHEAMEDQRVPINKAGINTVLPTETAILAAANPNGGEFDRFTPLTAQIDLEAPLISRFDLIFGLVDEQDEKRDAEIAHSQYESEPQEPVIDEGLLTEYVAYARQNVKPSFDDKAVEERLVNWYVEQRKKHEDSDGLNIGPRTNDALRRLSEASARMRLSPVVEMQDAERAIGLKKMHFGDVMFNRDGEFDAGQGEGYEPPKPTSQKERMNGVKELVEELETRDSGVANDDAVDAAVEKFNLSKEVAQDTVDSLYDKGELYEPQQGFYRST